MGILKPAAEIVSDAALQLGLVTAPIADPYASGTDSTIVLLTNILKSEGRRLARTYDWPILHRRHTFTTSNGVDSYALPEKFGRLINQTVWDVTEKRQVRGPMSPQEWEAVQAGALVATVQTSFRIFGDSFYLSPTPSSVRTIAYEYVTSGFTYNDEADDPEDDTDGATIVFDADLMVCALKLKFLTYKGLPSEAAQREYDTALGEAMDAATAAPVLSLSQSGEISFRPNIPDTGYGS